MTKDKVGKFLWRREWQSTSVFLPGEFQGQRSLVGYSPWGHKQLERLSDSHTHTHTHTHTHKDKANISAGCYRLTESVSMLRWARTWNYI